MNEQLKKYLGPIKNFWVNSSKKKKTILISVLAGIIVISVVVSALLNTQPYVVLYPGLESSEATEVMNQLKDRGVSFKEDNGTIYVPKDQENALRMELANEGYPKSALNYDFFTENTDIMSTDFEKKTIEKYQLNERLGAVIQTLDGVKNAAVTISIPDDSSYAWDDSSSAPSASVAVTMNSSKTLQAAQVNGIKQLVAKSVPNLKTDNVAVVDTSTGEEVGDSTSENQVNVSEFKRTIEKEYETDIEKNVLKVLTPLFGTDNVKVTAKSVMDVDKKVQEIITYKPSTDDNKGVISESDTEKEQQTQTASSGGTTGTQSNSDTSTYPGVTVDGNTIYTKDSQSYKYLVSSVKEQVQKDAASIQDLTISIVVNKTAMDDTQKEQISKLAANAAAVNASKVVIYNGAFATASESTPTQTSAETLPDMNQLLIYGGAGLGAILLILIIIAVLVGRRRKKRREKLLGLEEETGTVPDEFYQLKKDTPEEMRAKSEEEKQKAKEALQQMEKNRLAQASEEQALLEGIQDFSSQNPEIAAQLIRNWLKGEELDDGT
ncbi:MAG: flagellar M-ring protein FliF [Clostridiales bacterium]|nr:flagellar M-ring protein FliF [Clostridiales bacterium]